MKNFRQTLWIAAACAVGVVGCGAIAGCGATASRQAMADEGSPVTVAVDPKSATDRIAPDFAGVSMEIKTLLPDADGHYYFSPENKRLLATFKALGIENLRVGGNTADNPAVKIPRGRDIDNLFAFARAAHVRVIYTLRLRNSTNPQADAAVAKYVMDHYASQVVAFEIGNEPNIYAKTYPEYKKLLNAFITAIRNPACAPTATFCGPNTTPGKAEWARNVAIDFGKTGEVSLITQHAYFGGNGRKVTDVAAARQAMLSRKWVDQYQKMYASFVPTVLANHLPYRIEETNSFYNGGAKDVSNTYASALWGLDYLYWWASHHAEGLNFHTGDHVAAADESAPCWYALFWTSPQGYHVHPIGYAMKAFDLGSHGSLAPATVQSTAGLNVTAYAVVGTDHHLYVTVINKEYAQGKDAAVRVTANGYGHAEAMALCAPKNDLAAQDGETLGGAAIADDGSWKGKWTRAGAVVTVPAASALVVRMTAQ